MSTKIAKAFVIQNNLTSGGEVNAPTVKAMIFVKAEIEIEGPASARTSAILYSIESSGLGCFLRFETTLCQACIMRKESSTPIARIKKGVTRMIGPNLTPAKNINPKAAPQDMKGTIQAKTALITCKIYESGYRKYFIDSFEFCRGKDLLRGYLDHHKLTLKDYFLVVHYNFLIAADQIKVICPEGISIDRGNLL